MAHYSYDRPPKVHRLHGRPWVVAVFVVLAVGLFGTVAFVGLGRTGHKKTVVSDTTPKTAMQTGITSHMMFVGDVNWARQTQRRAEASGKSYDYLMSGINPAERAKYDAWIANFECPITTKDVPYQQQVDLLKFNCRPEYLPALAKFFTAATLANNHMDNNGGQWGLDQTRQNLQKNGIQYFGTYDMNDTQDLCEVVSMPAQTTGPKPQKTALPVALCGYMYVVDATPTDAQLAVMQQYAKVMPVISMPHMGVEYRTTAEDAKVSAYHRMIDNGADAVIGAHPHVIQNSESYKGHPIFYSEGNFLFDQQSVSAATNLALAVGLRLTISSSPAASKYMQVASQCKAFKDDCLTQLQKSITKRPAIQVSYDYNCYSITSGVPVQGTDAQCAAARQAATLNELSGLHKTW